MDTSILTEKVKNLIWCLNSIKTTDSDLTKTMDKTAALKIIDSLDCDLTYIKLFLKGEITDSPEKYKQLMKDWGAE